MIPANHKKIPFPFNLEDRVNFTLAKVKTIVNKDVNFNIKKLDNGIFIDLRNKNLARYEITFDNKSSFDKVKKDLKNIGFKLEKNKWIMLIE